MYVSVKRSRKRPAPAHNWSTSTKWIRWTLAAARAYSINCDFANRSARSKCAGRTPGCMLRCAHANNFNSVPWKMITHQIIWLPFRGFAPFRPFPFPFPRIRARAYVSASDPRVEKPPERNRIIEAEGGSASSSTKRVINLPKLMPDSISTRAQPRLDDGHDDGFLLRLLLPARRYVYSPVG